MLGKHLQQEVTFLSQNTSGYGDDTEGQILQPAYLYQGTVDRKEQAQKWGLGKK